MPRVRTPVPSEFSDGESVTDRHRPAPDQRLRRLVEHRTLCLFEETAERIGAVEHDDGDPRMRAGFEHVAHGPDVGVEACADIREIHQDDVEVGEVFRGGAHGGAVQAAHGNAP